MIRKDKEFWIKVIPITQKSNPSSIHLCIDGDEHCWNIYDESGRDNHKIYFKGNGIVPSFYLKSEEKSYKIDFDSKEIKVHELAGINDINSYVKKNCNVPSSQATCWAIDIYHTCNPDDFPFDIM